MKTFVINLDKRKDRMEEFLKLNITAERFSAIEGGAEGCFYSHKAILEMQVENNWDKVLILEDDVEFSTFTFELPDQWDQLYLGGNHHQKPIPINDRIAKCVETYSTHAYAMDIEYTKKIIPLLQNYSDPIDVVYARQHHKNNCLTFYPNIAFQKEGYSDIVRKHVNYDKYLR